MLSDSWMEVEMARLLAYRAASLARENPSKAVAYSSMAKVAASDCQYLGCKEGIQIHGGMGYTWESDVQLFVKRAKTLEALFGTGRAHRRRIADLLEV